MAQEDGLSRTAELALAPLGGAEGLLLGAESFTVFAPVDAAYDALGPDYQVQMDMNPISLFPLLLRHLLAGTVLPREHFRNGLRLETEARGGFVTLELQRDDEWFVRY